MIITTTNVGSLGPDEFEDLKPENIIVRHQLYDSIAKICNEVDAVDILAIQECRTFKFEPKPFFDLPTADSSQVSWGAGSGGTRGTCIYAGNDCTKIDLNDDKHEACAVKFCYKDSNRKNRQAVLINVYRNQSKDFTRTVAETVKFISSAINKIRYDHGIGKVVVVGDFNSTSITVPGLREYTHGDMFHKANKNAGKKFIDKIFSNISDVEIVSILPTCENKHNQPGSEELGHKVITIRVGKPANPQKTEITSVRYSTLKKIVANHSPKFNDLGLGPDTRNNQLALERHCLDFTNLLVHLTAKATSKKTIDRRRGPKINLVQHVNSHGDKVLSVKEAAKEVYNLVGFMKTGLDTPTDKKKPELIEFKNHLQEKLRNLNEGDFSRAKAIIDQAYANVKKSELKLPGRRKLKKIMMSTSSSGAKDHYGISLRVTKVFLGYNRKISGESTT